MTIEPPEETPPPPEPRSRLQIAAGFGTALAAVAIVVAVPAFGAGLGTLTFLAVVAGVVALAVRYGSSFTMGLGFGCATIVVVGGGLCVAILSQI